MKVLIGWSGEPAHEVALRFHKWLPVFIRAAEPRVFSEDIWTA